MSTLPIASLSDAYLSWQSSSLAIMGGSAATVAYSTNGGSTWTTATGQPFTALRGGAAGSIDILGTSYFFLTGGQPGGVNPTTSNTFTSNSISGIGTWTPVTTTAAYPSRYFHGLTVYAAAEATNGVALVVYGGYSASDPATPYADTWGSFDGGATWIRRGDMPKSLYAFGYATTASGVIFVSGTHHPAPREST